MRTQVEKVIQEVGKAVAGKREVIGKIVTAMLAEGHILLDDAPGVGKTTLATALSRAVGLTFRRIQFTPDVLPSDITGFSMIDRAGGDFVYRPGLLHQANLVLGDEINRAASKTQSALLEAMEEGKVTVDGTTYKLPSPFMVIATQNPHGFVGTYPLPEAQLDRFALKISMGYPSEEQETDILMARRGVNPLDRVQAVTDVEGVAKMRRMTAEATVDPEICRYVVNLVAATRKHTGISRGASPRASIAVMRMAQAYAVMQGREYVLPEDVKAVFVRSVAHRLVLTQEAKLARTTPESILAEISLKTPIPFRGSRD